MDNEEFQRERVKSAAFWVSPVDELNDLTPAEVLAGNPFRGRVEPINRFQQAILDEPFPSRSTRVVALIEAPDPTTIISRGPAMRIKFRGLNPLRWGFGYWRAPRGAAVVELGPLTFTCLRNE